MFKVSLSVFEQYARAGELLAAENGYRVPVMCSLKGQDPWRVLAPSQRTLGHFMRVFRDHCRLKETESWFLFVGPEATLCPLTSTFEELYRRHASPDGFLYIVAVRENVFG